MDLKRSSLNNEKFFSFTLSQKRGIFVLACIIFSLLTGIIVASSIDFEINEKQDFTEFQNQIALYEENLIRNHEANKKQYNNGNFASKSSFQSVRLTPFLFNPNALSLEDGKKLGLKEYQIKTIQNYLSKGGKFRKKEDFKKMYCINEQEYAILEPYIHIPVESNAGIMPPSGANKYVAKKDFLVDLNSADTTDLKELKGIGGGFANRIIKYRKLLGGFYSQSQLLEVWGFTADMLAKIESSLIINPESVQKININTATIDQLKQHPYLDYYVAKNIVKYRTERGKFNSPEDLLKVNLLYEGTFEKIKPYLSVQ